MCRSGGSRRVSSSFVNQTNGNMDEPAFFKLRIYFTVIVTVAIGSLLTWNYYNGGIPSHHLLADENLPKFSNLWGLLLLPLLTWVLSYRTQKRVFRQGGVSNVSMKITFYSFFAPLLYGITMSAFFSFGYPDMTGNLMFAIFVGALFFPVYRAECLLGFILGMTFTFGAVLPTIIGSILCVIAFILYKTIRPFALYLIRSLRGGR